MTRQRPAGRVPAAEYGFELLHTFPTDGTCGAVRCKQYRLDTVGDYLFAYYDPQGKLVFVMFEEHNSGGRDTSRPETLMHRILLTPDATQNLRHVLLTVLHEFANPMTLPPVPRPVSVALLKEERNTDPALSWIVLRHHQLSPAGMWVLTVRTCDEVYLRVFTTSSPHSESIYLPHKGTWNLARVFIADLLGVEP